MAKAEIRITPTLRVGDVVATVLGGEYRSARVEAIGADWVVLRGKDQLPRFLDVDPEVLVDERESRGGRMPEDLP